MMEQAGVLSIPTNGPSALSAMDGPNGETSGMKILTSMEMESNRAKHGGMEKMEISGIGHGANIIMGQDGFTNMAKVAVESIGIPIFNKIHGMRNTPTMGSLTASETLFS